MKLLVLNHKANCSYNDLEKYIEKIKKIKKDGVKLILCPSNIYLLKFINNNLCVGAQDVSIYSNGSYTGEITALQLKSLGVDYCIIGHSERRQYFNESDADINKKLKQLLANDITPILCVGESFKDKEYGIADDTIIRQLAEATKNIEKDNLNKIIVSYEPVWAIGSDVIPSTNYIDTKIKVIQDYFKEKGIDFINILYGGSVNDVNIEVLRNIDDLSGYLIGGAGLDPNKMSNLTNKL